MKIFHDQWACDNKKWHFIGSGLVTCFSAQVPEKRTARLEIKQSTQTVITAWYSHQTILKNQCLLLAIILLSCKIWPSIFSFWKCSKMSVSNYFFDSIARLCIENNNENSFWHSQKFSIPFGNFIFLAKAIVYRYAC